MEGHPRVVVVDQDLTGKIHHGIYQVVEDNNGAHILVDSNGAKLVVDEAFYQECFGDNDQRIDSSDPLPAANY